MKSNGTSEDDRPVLYLRRPRLPFLGSIVSQTPGHYSPIHIIVVGSAIGEVLPADG